MYKKMDSFMEISFISVYSIFTLVITRNTGQAIKYLLRLLNSPLLHLLLFSLSVVHHVLNRQRMDL